jgi:hypothetical protein
MSLAFNVPLSLMLPSDGHQYDKDMLLDNIRFFIISIHKDCVASCHSVG